MLHHQIFFMLKYRWLQKTTVAYNRRPFHDSVIAKQQTTIDDQNACLMKLESCISAFYLHCVK
jgi:hypothetical protein